MLLSIIVIFSLSKHCIVYCTTIVVRFKIFLWILYCTICIYFKGSSTFPSGKHNIPCSGYKNISGKNARSRFVKNGDLEGSNNYVGVTFKSYQQKTQLVAMKRVWTKQLNIPHLFYFPDQ